MRPIRPRPLSYHARCALVLLMAIGFAFGTFASPVFAQDRRTLPDVSPDHWAAAAVNDVAVEHRLMPTFKDGTFKGDAIFTRLDFAKTLAAFINEMETVTGVSLADSSFSFYAFDDIDEASDRSVVEPLANQYNIFDGIPGIGANKFQPKRPVTRYELAAVFDKLFRLAEKKRLISPPRARDLQNPFTDVRQLDFAYQAVLNTVLRYQILTGFPDATFRGNIELTRYQFAAAAARAFGIIREQVSGVVRQRLPKGQLEGLSYTKFHGDDPTEFTLHALTNLALPGGGSFLAVPSDSSAVTVNGGLLMLSWRNHQYPPTTEFKQYRDWAYPDSLYSNWQLETYLIPPKIGTAKPALGALDGSLLGVYSQRWGINDRNAEPFHYQGYTGWYAWPDLAVGTTGGIQGGITVGGGPLAGFALFHRVSDPFGYSISLELGAGPFAGFRFNNGSLNVPTSSSGDAPTTLAELGVSGAASGFAAPFGGHLMSKFILSLEFFSRPNNSNHLDITVYTLPGGIHDNPQSYFKAALAAGIGFGSSWK